MNNRPPWMPSGIFAILSLALFIPMVWGLKLFIVVLVPTGMSVRLGL
jgi:hypothetical protein